MKKSLIGSDELQQFYSSKFYFSYSGINKFGQAFRGELTPQELQQLAFDTSMNVTGGSLLGSFTDPRTWGFEFGAKF